jgi:hypothetical protein
MDRAQIDDQIDRLRTEHPERAEFVAAVQSFSQTLDPEARRILGEALLQREPETGGFDVLNRRLEQGGWIRRTMRKIEESERRDRLRRD